MGVATTTVAPQGTGQPAAAAVAAVPFIRASMMQREATGIDVSRQMTTSDQDFGTFDVPANGYLRALVLVVTTSGGAGTAVTATEDAPFNILKGISLAEPNGAVIQQFNSGHDMYLANRYGGYRGYNDPRANPTYTLAVGAAANASFVLRVPVELNIKDALGPLPNQNAAATFKLRFSLARIADVFGGTVSTAPTVRVRVYTEFWAQPEMATAGAVNQTTPPAVNTTQFWTAQPYNVSAGQQSIRLTRVGNYLRNLILVFRRGGTSRVLGDADIPDPLTLWLDTRPVDLLERNNWLTQIYERTGYGSTFAGTVPPLDSAGGRDAGVLPYDFTHELNGTIGHENRDLWLPTLGSTRLELQGNFPNAGVLTVLTNDVALAGNVFL